MKLIGFGFAIAVSTAAFAQFPPLRPTGEKAGAEFIGYLDVAATGPSGKPVPGLTAADFEVSQDGKPLSIAKFTAGGSDAHSVVLVVDDLGLTLPGLDRVRQALEKFLEDGLAVGDRAAIVRTSGGSASLLQLTSDKRVLAEELERIDVHPLADATGTQPAPFLAGTLQGLRAVVDGLRGVPGRKAVVLLSERLTLSVQSASQANLAVESIALRCTELAEMAEAVFYAINVRAGSPAPAVSQLQIATGVAGIAADTGGMILDSAAGLPGALERVLRDQTGFYRIGFSSGESYRDFATGTSAYRKIAVRTGRTGVSLRARKNVYGPPPKPVDNAIAVDLTPLLLPDPGSGTFVNLLIRADARSLASVLDLKGQYNSLLEVDVTVFDASGQAGTETQRPLQARIPEAGFEAAQKFGIIYPFQIRINKEGIHRIQVRVTDGTGGRSGLSSEMVAVPVRAGGELMLSGIVLAPPAREQASPERAIAEGPAVRRYPKGATFRYAYDLSNLAQDGEHRSAVEMYTTLLRHGRPLTTIQPHTVSFDAAPNVTRRDVSGEVILPKSLAPGRYVLTVTVVDKLAAKPREVAQSTDFWITP